MFDTFLVKIPVTAMVATEIMRLQIYLYTYQYKKITAYHADNLV